MAKLSKNAEYELTAAPGYAQGTVINASANLAVAMELMNAGMIGPHGGLTRKGSIRAQQLKRAEEERLFPL